MMTEVRRDPRRDPRRSASWAALALVAVMLVVPASAPLCASRLGVCALPEAAPPVDAHCPLAAAMGHAGGEPEDMATMDCCVSDAAPQGPAPAVPDGERQLQGASLVALVPAAGSFELAALPAAAPPAPPAADLAASAVPLYTLLATLLR